MFFTYVLHSRATGRYYIGSTQDLSQRLTQHNSGMMRATRPGRPWIMVHSESFDSRSDSLRREQQIKRWKIPPT